MSTIRSSYFEPKSLSQLLSSALREATSHSASGFVAVALIMLPVALVQLVGAYAMTELGITELQEQMQSGQMAPEQFDLKPLLFAERAIGKDIGAMGAWDASLRSFFKVLAGSIVQMLLYGAALLVLLIPVAAVSAVLGASMGEQAAGSSQVLIQVVAGGMLMIPFVIVGRSFGLISGNFGRTFLAILIGVTCLAVPMGVLNWVMNSLALESLQGSLGDSFGAVAAATPGALVFLLVMPFIYSLHALIYFDLRSRDSEQEDFSPAELALDLGEALSESVAPSAVLLSYLSDCRTDMRGGAVLDDVSVLYSHNSFGALPYLTIMGDQHDSDALLVEIPEEADDSCTGPGVEVAGWLICQQNGGFRDQGPRDRHALLLASGQLAWLVAGSISHAHPVECLLCKLATTSCSRIQQGKHHVLQGSSPGQQVEGLEHKADLVAADLR